MRCDFKFLRFQTLFAFFHLSWFCALVEAFDILWSKIFLVFVVVYSHVPCSPGNKSICCLNFSFEYSRSIFAVFKKMMGKEKGCKNCKFLWEYHILKKSWKQDDFFLQLSKAVVEKHAYVWSPLATSGCYQWDLHSLMQQIKVFFPKQPIYLLAFLQHTAIF